VDKSLSGLIVFCLFSVAAVAATPPDQVDQATLTKWAKHHHYRQVMTTDGRVGYCLNTETIGSHIPITHCLSQPLFSWVVEHHVYPKFPDPNQAIGIVTVP